MIGIYKILNTVNGKFYIGSSNNIDRRFSHHKWKLKNNNHDSIKLQLSYNKYGINAFEFVIVEECTKETQLVIEQHYIDTYKPEFNIALSATAPMLGKTGKLCPNYGKTHTEETRLKISKTQTGKKHTKETRQKMSENSGTSRKIIDSNGNMFDSICIAAQFWNISRFAVYDILKGRHNKTRKGISFKYGTT